LKRLGARYKVLDNTILSNLPVIIALIMLACAPFFLLQNQEVIANQNAKYALPFNYWRLVENYPVLYD
jgi:hypothetical protein